MGVPYAEVIGDPIAHSKSPIIHKFWLEKLGMEGDYRRVQVRAGELESYLAEIAGPEHRPDHGPDPTLKATGGFAEVPR